VKREEGFAEGVYLSIKIRFLATPCETFFFLLTLSFEPTWLLGIWGQFP